MAVTPALTILILGAGVVAGALGATLGLGGGIFLVPLLHLGLGFPITVAAAISLTTVIATSSSVSAHRAGQHLINMRLGMLLEVATAAGSLGGGITAQLRGGPDDRSEKWLMTTRPGDVRLERPWARSCASALPRAPYVWRWVYCCRSWGRARTPVAL